MSSTEENGRDAAGSNGDAALIAAESTPILNIQSTGQIKMRNFDGKENWRLFLQQFTRVGKMNGWQDHMVDYLWIHLSGEALAYVEDLPDAVNLTYAELCKQLEVRFSAERLSSLHKAELLSKKRKKGEGLAELGQSIRRLVQFAYPRITGDAREELAVEKFVDALDDAELRRAIYQEDPKTLAEAIDSGFKNEAWGIIDEKK